MAPRSSRSKRDHPDNRQFKGGLILFNQVSYTFNQFPINMYHTYILYSNTSNQFYTGHTVNLQNRLLEHNSGETKSIAKGTPWKLIWQAESDSRGKAMQLEKKIKSRGARRFLQDLDIVI